MDNNGGQVDLKVGGTLVVKLESNPTTGYSWEVGAIDPSIIKGMGDAEYAKSDTGETPLVGSGGAETWRFQAVNEGQTSLEMVYRRPWEQDVNPEKTFSLSINVQGN